MEKETAYRALSAAYRRLSDENEALRAENERLARYLEITGDKIMGLIALLDGMERDGSDSKKPAAESNAEYIARLGLEAMEDEA